MITQPQDELFFIFDPRHRRAALWNVPAMTRFAVLRCRLVEEDPGSIHLLLQRVAGRALHVFMTTFQRESRFLVIEKRRPPLLAVVA